MVYWMIGIVVYLLIGIVLAFKTPYRQDVPFYDNVILVIGWIPIIIWLQFRK